MVKRKPKADELALFRAWLTEHGAEVLEPTNEYELVRFRSDKGTSILYRNGKGDRTPTGHTPAEIRQRALDLAHHLREALCQHSFSVVMPNETV